MTGHYPLADPPRTLAERLEQLNDNLHSLGGRLKEAIASAVSSAVAEAIQDALRNLLGARTLPDPVHRYDQWREPDNGIWNETDESRWNEEREYHPGYHESPEKHNPGPSPWPNALSVGVQTALWWVRQQPRRRPVLTTVTMAVVAGVTALIAGPVLAAGVGVLASAASLLVTANAAGTLTDKLGSFFAG
jgi:hypothetical protein